MAEYINSGVCCGWRIARVFGSQQNRQTSKTVRAPYPSFVEVGAYEHYHCDGVYHLVQITHSPSKKNRFQKSNCCGCKEISAPCFKSLGKNFVIIQSTMLKLVYFLFNLKSVKGEEQQKM